MECLTGNLILATNIKTNEITRCVTVPIDIMSFSAISRNDISRRSNIINGLRNIWAFTRAAKHMGVSNLTGKRLKNIKD